MRHVVARDPPDVGGPLERRGSVPIAPALGVEQVLALARVQGRVVAVATDREGQEPTHVVELGGGAERALAHLRLGVGEDLDRVEVTASEELDHALGGARPAAEEGVAERGRELLGAGLERGAGDEVDGAERERHGPAEIEAEVIERRRVGRHPLAEPRAPQEREQPLLREILGDVGERAHRRRVLALLAHEDLDRAPLERQPPGEHLEEHDADAVEIGGRTDRGGGTACSGAMYAAVPITAESLDCRESESRTSPKSRMTTRPAGVTMTFDGSRSRWTLPARCSTSRPWASWSSAARR